MCRFICGLAVVALVAMSGSSLAGCTKTSCKTNARYGLRVVVIDAAGKPVCDASVTATDGAFTGRLSAFVDPDACPYFGVPERTGTYSVTARKGTKTKTVDGVKVTADVCHVHTADVRITLV